MVFFIILILLPLLEIFTFIAVIDEIGFLSSFLLCILSAAIGVALVQKQGLDTMMRGQRELNAGTIPAKELLDGLCLFIAGAFLIIPGFLTDLIGFALLIPPLRTYIQAAMLRHMDVRVHAASAHYTASPAPRQGDVVEGTFERVDDGDETGRIDHRP